VFASYNLAFALQPREKHGKPSVRVENPQSVANTHPENIRTLHLLTARRWKCVMFSVCVVAELSVAPTNSSTQVPAIVNAPRTAPGTTTPRGSCITSILSKFSALGGDGQLQASDPIYIRGKLTEKLYESCG
jgi:hypothetical protein